MSLRAYFDGFFGVMEKLDTRAELETAARWVAEFYVYFDSLAAAKPEQFHHVYEFGMVGNRSARLFELDITPMGISTMISYKFLPAKVPNENGYLFVDKAEVMESGAMVEFETEKAVPINPEEGEFRTGRFTFKPGGPQTTGAFGDAFMTFFAAKIAKPPRGSSTVIYPTAFTKQAGMADGVRLYDSIVSK